MNRLSLLLVIFLSLLFCSSALAEDTIKDYRKQLRPYQESKISGPFFNEAYGYAFFPTIGKGGAGLGGAYGRGQVYRNGKITGTTSLFKLTIGFQLGGQAFSEIIFFQDKRAYNDFIDGAFELDATASAVAITAGAQASAGTGGSSAGVSTGPQTGEQLGGDYFKGTAIFIHTKGGLMYEAVIGGQKFKFRPL
jgi:lipid-binding SYLF domain-containing protein